MPDEALKKFRDPNYQPTKFSSELAHSLQYHVEEVKVTVNGIRSAFGAGARYKSIDLGQGFGRTVKVWYKVLGG